MIFPRWVTWTGGVLGTPSQPGSLAPQNCSGRRQGREDAFSLWIGLSPCLPNGECQTCGLWKVTKKQQVLLILLTLAGDSTPGQGLRHCELIVSLQNARLNPNLQENGDKQPLGGSQFRKAGLLWNKYPETFGFPSLLSTL